MNKLIILCATQRCGSTMVVDDMRSSGIMGRPEEYFIPWDPNKEVNWVDDFENIKRRASTENGIVAIKVMANQLENIEACLKSVGYPPVSEDVYFPRVKSLFKGALFIRLKRDNIVRQAISRVMARKTGVNHSVHSCKGNYTPGNVLKGNLKDYNKSVDYNKSDIDQEILNIAKESLLWESVLEGWGIISPLELHYEQVCRAYPNYIKRISSYIKIDIDCSILPGNRNLKKMSNSKNDKFVDKYLREK